MVEVGKIRNSKRESVGKRNRSEKRFPATLLMLLCSLGHTRLGRGQDKEFRKSSEPIEYKKIVHTEYNYDREVLASNLILVNQ